MCVQSNAEKKKPVGYPFSNKANLILAFQQASCFRFAESPISITVSALRLFDCSSSLEAAKITRVSYARLRSGCVDPARALSDRRNKVAIREVLRSERSQSRVSVCATARRDVNG
ncbi:hypothetical protein EVAR_67460_1 [Eumeta japonica]|uniref:Uncharacterized protein n=1 Tax=Eumeta variegata TaxID=151549 RepID=A0A4C1ZTL4_EUMVA|nr:hypothetical protein EVAR_67460_1 [Eumeta japonica]